MTVFADLVGVSQRVGATPARRAKVHELARFLAALPAQEIDTAVHYLAGEIPQGRIGIGYATLQSAAAGRFADAATLSIADVDQRLAELAETRGAGSAARRTQRLGELFAWTTLVEQDFLLRLLVGELRQGALGGVMLDAIAAAAKLPAASVRRAAMYATSLGSGGARGTARGRGRSRAIPARAVRAGRADARADRSRCGRGAARARGKLAFEWKMDGARIQVHKARTMVRIYTRAIE